MFALMSGKKQRDYRAIFKAIKNLLSSKNLPINLETFTLDYEKAVWKAVRGVFGLAIIIYGCLFHWSQAVWKCIQREGLQVPYKDDPDVRRYLTQLMALPYLPAEHIPGAGCFELR